jgi:hypothetical protein
MKFLDVPQSGSIAGSTHSRNRAGQYKRNRVSPCQPTGSGRRATVRAAFGSASSHWSGLTRAQQEAWVAYADSYPYTDSLGQSIKLTGHQMCVAINCNLLNSGGALRVLPPTDNVTDQLTSVEIVATAGTPTMEISWSGGLSTGSVLISFSPPQSSGRLTCKQFWQLGMVAATESDLNCLSAYVAEYGALAVGQRIFARVCHVNADGVQGVPSFAMVQVAA